MNFTQGNQSHKQPIINKSEALSETIQGVAKTAPMAEVAQGLSSLGKDVIRSTVKDLGGGLVNDFVLQLLGQPKISPESLSKPTPSASQEALTWKKKFQQSEMMRKEYEVVIIRKQQETSQKITAIRQELKIQVASLGTEVKAWSREIEIATFQAPATPGIYHELFFDQLISFVKNLRQRVNHSRHWLQVQNAKASKKKGLWGMAATKTGNTYNQEILFSGERSVSMNG